jgi:cation transport regulator ChaC
MDGGTWIFAYGSLMFRPGFGWVERIRARGVGWVRRFHQGSPDHRGTPENLGRVVTLVHSAADGCEGLAYRIEGANQAAILRALDEREQGGYVRAAIPLALFDGRSITAVTWIASPSNPYWLGEEPLDAIIARIRRAHGPSGANRDYVLELREILREQGIFDPHVEEIATAIELNC